MGYIQEKEARSFGGIAEERNKIWKIIFLGGIVTSLHGSCSIYF